MNLSYSIVFMNSFGHDNVEGKCDTVTALVEKPTKARLHFTNKVDLPVKCSFQVRVETPVTS